MIDWLINYKREILITSTIVLDIAVLTLIFRMTRNYFANKHQPQEPAE